MDSNNPTPKPSPKSSSSLSPLLSQSAPYQKEAQVLLQQARRESQYVGGGSSGTDTADTNPSTRTVHHHGPQSSPSPPPSQQSPLTTKTRPQDDATNDVPAVRLSHSTPYEHEAEALLQQAKRAEEHKAVQALQQQGKSSKEIRAKLLQAARAIQAQLDQEEEQQTQQQPQSPPPDNASSLAHVAGYLMALHRQGSGTATTTNVDTDHPHINNNKNQKPELARMHATDRFHETASVLRAAASLQSRSRATASSSSKQPGRQSTSHRREQQEEPPSVAVAGISTTFETAGSTSPRNNTATEQEQQEEEGGVMVPDDEEPSNAVLVTTSLSHRSSMGAAAGGGGGRNSHHSASSFLASLSAVMRKQMTAAVFKTKDEVHSLHDFFQPKRARLQRHVVFCLCTILLPSLALAAILFYGMDNPPTGRCRREDEPCGANANNDPKPSASWWILWLGCRQVVTFLLAKFSDVFFIDWLLLQHSFLVRLLGPAVSLIIVQSKGWPSVTFWWALWDAMLLYGKGSFNHHWLYWQDAIGMFNDENPSGTVATADWFRRIIAVMIIVALSVSFKRYLLGLHLGVRLYVRFNDRLEETMKEMTLISELAVWTRRKRDQGATYAQWLSDYAEQEEQDPQPWRPTASATSQTTAEKPTGSESERLGKEGTERSSLFKSSYIGETMEYEKLLEDWDEPKGDDGEDASGDNVIAFRQAFAVMTRPFFFSSAFGPVDSRNDCIRSADRLFRRLLLLFEEEETIDVDNLTRWMYKGCKGPGEKESAAHLIMLLNPDIENRLNVLDFVSGIDKIYQRVRLLEYAVNNASHIDREYEKVINGLFYLILGCVVLAILRLDPITVLVSLSSLIVAFSFMIGPGSATYFEGVVMILGRQPYDVGDKIAIANVDDPPNLDGSTHWMVENINLVSTTARLMGTNEVASFSNGALARCRLINMNRSPNPIVYVYVRFGTDVPYSTIGIFRTAVEKFVEDRPQEWQAMLGFRTTRVEAQLNFVEYMAVLQHRLTWQSLVPVKESRAAVASFCVEIQKQLGCRYNAPSLPVEISLMDHKDNETSSGEEKDDSNLVSSEGGDDVNRSESVDRLMEFAQQFKKQDST